MISDKLLSKILNVYSAHINDTGLLEVKEKKDSPIISNINCNFYELSNRCKEWALAHGYEITSKQFIMYDGSKRGMATVNDDIGTQWDCDTEVEAIFGICEWILEEQS